MSSLTDLAAEFIEVRTRRLALEKEAAELKAGRETELKQTILQVMAAQGLKSAHIEGKGRVVSKVTSHYEITDPELLAFHMFKNMVAAAQAGRPLTDALLLQRRVHADNLTTFIDSQAGEAEAIATSIGVRKVDKTDLSFTKVSS